MKTTEQNEDWSPAYMMDKQKEFDKIRLVKGLEENIIICNEQINKHTNKLNDWQEIKRLTLIELNQLEK